MRQFKDKKYAPSIELVIREMILLENPECKDRQSVAQLVNIEQASIKTKKCHNSLLIQSP